MKGGVGRGGICFDPDLGTGEEGHLFSHLVFCEGVIYFHTCDFLNPYIGTSDGMICFDSDIGTESKMIYFHTFLFLTLEQVRG